MRRAILLLSVIALLLASCGSDTDEGQDAEPTGSPAASARATGAAGSPTPQPTLEYRLDYEFPPWDEVVEQFSYDTSEPLGFTELGREHEGGATVVDVEYMSAGSAVPAWLVIPDGKGPFPVVLYAHGWTGTRDYFLGDALALAEAGYAGLLITGPEARDPYLPITTTWDARLDLKGAVRYTTDLRRGIDLLEALPEIDATRIGFVGYSAGALPGAYLAGLEDRIDAYVFASGGQGYPCTDVGDGTLSCHVTDDFRSWPSPPGQQELERYMDKAGMLLGNSVPYVRHNQGAAFLIQMGTGDEWVSTSTVDALYEAVPEPKSLEWYELGHTLGCRVSLTLRSCDASVEAFADHRAWLQENV